MRNIVKKIIRLFKYIGVIFLVFYYRFKNIGKKKGVAQVVNSFNNGGLEQVAANLYKTFKANGNNSAVISISNNVGPMMQQIYTPKDVRIIYYDVIEMLKYCAKNNIRTLMFHFSTFHMILFKILGFRNYYIIHNTYIWYTPNEWENLKIKLKFCDGIVAVSEWCKSYFEKKTGINNIKVILNGIDFDNINSGEKSSLDRKSIGIKPEDIVCLTIGSYTDGKHQNAIVGIAEEVIKKNNKVKFITVGPKLDLKVYNKFVKSVKKSKAKDNIKILDYIPQNEIGDFITKNCDIYLQPSVHEAGVPLTVMEALLKGKPVIMTDFMISKSFPNTKGITGVKPPYEDILQITPKMAHEFSTKIKDKSTKDFAEAVLNWSNKIKEYEQNFKFQDYEFLKLERMSKEYLNFIKI